MERNRGVMDEEIWKALAHEIMSTLNCTSKAENVVAKRVDMCIEAHHIRGDELHMRDENQDVVSSLALS